MELLDRKDNSKGGKLMGEEKFDFLEKNKNGRRENSTFRCVGPNHDAPVALRNFASHFNSLEKEIPWVRSFINYI
jgi:hypothetical protein